ncbi:GlxA family transcriptional regulator, partial [Thioclava sp. BHET1]
MQAFSSALEPLRIANQLTGQMLYRWHTVTLGGGSVHFSNGVMVTPDGAMGELPRNAMVLACAGVEPEHSVDPAACVWIRNAWRRGHVVGGICTGAYTLAGAGLLGDHEFTLHWENIDAFEGHHPDLHPMRQLYTTDRRVVTCGGGTAATDLMLHLIGRDYGPELCRTIMDMCIHPAARAAKDQQHSSHSFRFGIRHARLSAVLAEMEADLGTDAPLAEIAERHGLSRRQLERLFLRYVGKSPSRFRMQLRLERARILLTTTEKTVSEIAFACGYDSANTFSRQFTRELGVSPRSYSARSRLPKTS